MLDPNRHAHKCIHTHAYAQGGGRLQGSPKFVLPPEDHGILINLGQPLGLPIEEIEDAAMLEDGMDWPVE